MRRHRSGSRPVTGPLAAVLIATAACGAAPAKPAAPTLLDVAPAAVQRVVIDSGGRHAEFTQNGNRVWRAGTGGTDEGAALLLGAEERLFPLRAYRQMHLDPADPALGLAAPAALLTVDAGGGAPRTIAVGAATFNGGGFYARIGNEGDIFLVPRSVLADLRSLVEGRPVVLPQIEDAKIKQVYEDNEKQAATPTESPWVSQALEAGAALPEVTP
jgi:hypothetical protein